MSSRSEASCAATRLTFERQELTGFGQTWHVRRDMPVTTNKTVQLTRYNKMGWKERESTWFLHADGAISNETGAFRDGLVGLRRLRPAGGGDSARQFHDHLPLRGCAVGRHGSERGAEHLGHGNLRPSLGSFRPAGAAGPGGGGLCLQSGGPVGQISEYSFDEAGHLTKVCQNGSGATCGQRGSSPTTIAAFSPRSSTRRRGRRAVRGR